jgi:hypothetical protein
VTILATTSRCARAVLCAIFYHAGRGGKSFSNDVRRARDFGAHEKWKIETVYHWKDPVRFSCRRRHRPDVDPLPPLYDRPLEETVKCQHPKPWTRSTALAVNNTCTSLFYFTSRPPTATSTAATATTAAAAAALQLTVTDIYLLVFSHVIIVNNTERSVCFHLNPPGLIPETTLKEVCGEPITRMPVRKVTFS